MNKLTHFEMIALMVSLLASGATLPAFDTTNKSPNFLIILTDDQSWVGTSLLMDPANPDSKSDYYHTPNLDALVSQGIRFTDGYASGAWCTPTRRSIQSGMSPSQHIYNRAGDEKESEFPKLLSIPRLLKSVNPNYICAHFGKWHLNYQSITPEIMGYDVSDGNTSNENGDLANKDSAVATAKNVPDIWDDPKHVFSLSERTGDFIQQQTKAGRPWFVQLSEYAVHLKISYRQKTYDNLEGRPLGQKHTVREMAAMTEDLDAAIGQLMSRLKALKVINNTYIIFLSDNGGRGKLPVAGELVASTTQGINYPLAESKHSIYEGGLRVPFAISGPGIAAGTVSHVPVVGTDILPTIADLAGYAQVLSNQLDGGSFKDVALGKATTVKRAHDFIVFASEGGEKLRHIVDAKRSEYKAALRQGDFKLIKFYGGAGNGQKELYNLVDDLGENKNLVLTMPDRVAQMETLLDRYLADVGGRTSAEVGERKVDKKKAKE